MSQQISVAGARTLLGRLVGDTFPRPQELLDLDLADIGLTGARQRNLRALSEAVVNGDLRLDSSVDRVTTRTQLLALPGIGPWTADVIAMRALGDTDVLLGSDLIIKRQLTALEIDTTDHLAPWRSYVTCALWANAHTTKA